MQRVNTAPSAKRRKRDVSSAGSAMQKKQQKSSLHWDTDPLFTQDIHAHYYVHPKAPNQLLHEQNVTKEKQSAAIRRPASSGIQARNPSMHPSMPQPLPSDLKRHTHSSQSTKRPQLATNLSQSIPSKPSALRLKLGLPQRSSSAMATALPSSMDSEHASQHKSHTPTPNSTAPLARSLDLSSRSMLPAFDASSTSTSSTAPFKDNYVSSPLSPIPCVRSSSNASSTLSMDLPQTAYDVLFNRSAQPPPINIPKTKPKVSLKSKTKKAKTIQSKSKATKKKSLKSSGGQENASHHSLEDGTMHMLYVKSRERVLRLWDELRIPQAERVQIAEKYFSIHPQEITQRSIMKLSKYIEKLMQHRKNTLHVLKQIDIRESYLLQLRELVNAFEERHILNYAALTQQVVQLISKIRLATLDTVEAIVEWRQGLTIPMPFIWKTTNYLLKIQRDLDFFRQSSLSSLVEGGDMTDDDGAGGDMDSSPTVAHGDGVEFFSQSKFTDSNSALKQPPRRGSLPPLKTASSASSGKGLGVTTDFLRRIQNAAHIITNESNLSETVMNQLKSSEEYIPTLKNGTPMTARLDGDIDSTITDSVDGEVIGGDSSTGVAAIMLPADDALSKTFQSKIKPIKSTTAKKTSIKAAARKSPSPTQKRKRKKTRYESIPLDEESVGSPVSVDHPDDPYTTVDLKLLEDREHQCATVIQAVFKGYLERKRFFLLKQSNDLCNECAIRIQQAWRSFKAQMIAKEMIWERNVRRQLEEQAATTIQSAFRVKQARDVYQQKKAIHDHKSHNASIIQSAWRGVLGRRDAANYKQMRSEYALHLQTTIRALLVQSDYTVLDADYNYAATKIQALYRGYIDRKEWSPHLGPMKQARTKAAIEIQRLYRGHASRQETEHWIYVRERSLEVILPVVKQFLAKRKVQKLRRAWEMDIQRELEHEQAALTIQRIARGMFGRQVAQHERVRRTSAIKIQTIVRYWRASKRVQLLRLEEERKLHQLFVQEEAALKLQSHFRRIISKRYHELVKQTKNTAAVDIQRVYRSYLARKFVVRWKSAIVLQRNARAFLAKLLVHRIKAARKIEALALGWFARKRYLLLLEAYIDEINRGIEQEEAAVVIQRCARVLLSKRQTLHKRKRFLDELISYEQQEYAALQIQRIARGFIAKKVSERVRMEIPLHNAATKIQTAARVLLSRNRALLLRAEKHRLEQELYERELPLRKLQTVSAIQIQRIARGYLARQQIKKRPYDTSASVIQRAARSWMLRIHTKRHLAALCVQSMWRSLVAQSTYTQTHIKFNAAATIIQRDARVWLARKFVHRTRAAIEIQRVVRGWLGRRRFAERRALHIRHEAALKIQRVARQFLAKLYVQRWRAANIIQRAYRVHFSKVRTHELRRVKEETIRFQRHTAAATIQRVVRGHQARLFVKDYTQRANRASLIIQGQARIFLAKKIVQKEKSARTIQGCAKQFLARERAAEMAILQEQTIENSIRRERAALMIQKMCRGHLVRSHMEHHRRVHSKEDAASCIQRCIKTFLAKKHIQRLREVYKHEMDQLLECEHAALVIQRNARVLLARGISHRLRAERTRFESARIIQLCARVAMAKRRVRELKKVENLNLKALVRQEMASIELQRVARGFLSRLRVRRILNRKAEEQRKSDAAFIIQGAWNGLLDRRDVRRMQQALIIFQSCVRSQLTQNRISRREGSALTIQLNYRSYRARSTLRFKNANAIKIQTAVRSYLSRKRLREQFITMIQSQIRSYMQQLRYKGLLVNRAAVIIQKNFKAFHMKSMAKNYVSELHYANQALINNVIVREYAALTIQCAWRQSLARKAVHRQVRENICVSVLQRAWRLYKAKQLRLELEQRRNNVQLVQNRARQILSHTAFNDRLALDVLDFADYLIGEQQESIKLQSVVKIQRVARPFIARHIVEKRRQEKRDDLQKRLTMEWYSSKHHIHSVLNVQHCTRRNLAHLQVAHDKHLRSMHNGSAQKIQLCYKMYRAKRMLLALRRRKRREVEFEQRLEESSILVQSLMRQLRSQSDTEAFRKALLVGQVQRMILAQLARNQTGLLKARHVQMKNVKEQTEAFTIVNVPPEHDDDVMVQKEHVSIRLNEDIAAQRIQCMFRRYDGWRRLEESRREHHASIESLVKHDAKERSAVTIQCAVRFAQARSVIRARRMELMKEEQSVLDQEVVMLQESRALVS